MFIPDEGPESSTEDLSRAYSPSLSSSNEDILKPTARIGDRGDCDLMDHQINSQNDWLLRSAVRPESGSIQYPPQFGAGSKLNSIDLAYLKDLEVSSTADSQTASTLAATNKEVESSTSFEYHDNDMIRSPFQREIQRILDSSASKIPVAINRINANENRINAKSNHHTSNGDSNAHFRLNQRNIDYEYEPSQKSSNYMQVLIGGGSAIATVHGKHPVGLDAIKEIAKNTGTSDSSQMQTSDAESLDMLDDLEEHPNNQNHVFNIAQQRQHKFESKNLSVEENDEDMYDMEDEYRLHDKMDLTNSKTINDILKYGAHHTGDSNPIETQSEWSDDGEEDEAKGIKSFIHHFEYFNLKFFFSFSMIKGGAESTGYITDEPGLENLSLLNEAGLTDAEAALSDVNSCNAHDVDDTSVSSRASSRLLSLDSLSGFYDNEQEPTTNKSHEKAIMNVSSKITNKFGSQAL